MNGRTIYPDVHWNDTSGNRIEAHSAGMLQSPLDRRWYWYGESRKTDLILDHGVNCYSADTIAGPWRFEGRVVTQELIKQPDVEGPFVIERPKVLYNAATKRFVMWFHLDTSAYLYRHVGIAQSTSPVGPFQYVHGMKPDGINSLDMSLFQDPVDGQAYLVRSCDNNYTGISRLTPDYLNSTGIISNHSVFEGMALFRHDNGTYYMITSHLTGWTPNPLMLFRANGQTLDDPQWVNMGNPTHSNSSFSSQPTYVVQYTPKSGESYFVYMADDWIRCPNANHSRGPLVNACYIWLPIHFPESPSGAVTITWQDRWDLDDPYASLPSKDGLRVAAPPEVHALPTKSLHEPFTCTASDGAQVADGRAVGLAACSESGEPTSAGQHWQVLGNSTHAGPISLVGGCWGLCLDLSAGFAALKHCAGGGTTQFFALAEGRLRRADAGGECLAAEGARLDSRTCDAGDATQGFLFNAATHLLESLAAQPTSCATVCALKKQDLVLLM